MTPFNDSIYHEKPPIAPLAIVAMPGAKELAEKIDSYLVKWYKKSSNSPDYLESNTFILPTSFPRFTTGDGKGMIHDTVRGKDLYIIADVGNHGVTYPMFGRDVPMTPDEHFADIKRVICAANGKANRITVVMPLLYGGRQHRRTARESLDCAMMLQELEALGVKDIITFDAHDPRVQNAVPFMGFDNFFPTYQILKALTKRFPETELSSSHLMVVSPDEGAMARNIYYASVLGLDLGMFYKRRDYTRVVNGRNPIISHEYIGSSVMGMDVFVADDLIATGDSMIKLAQELKDKGANKIFLTATFALFTEGVEKFQKAYEEGLFTAVISTNLTYRIPELKNMEWFIETDLSKYVSYIIAACNHNESLSSLLMPIDKIKGLLDKINK